VVGSDAHGATQLLALLDEGQEGLDEKVALGEVWAGAQKGPIMPPSPKATYGTSSFKELVGIMYYFLEDRRLLVHCTHCIDLQVGHVSTFEVDLLTCIHTLS